MSGNAGWRKWTRLQKTALAFGVVLAAYAAFIGVRMYWLQPALIISRETTFITEPLRSDGTPDYAAALHEECSKGVTPGNNAAVPLARAFGPAIIAPEIRERYFQLIGIEPPPADGEYLITLDEFLQQTGVEQERQIQLLEAYSAVELRDIESNYPELIDWLAENEKPLEQITGAARRTRFFSPLLTVSASEPLINGLMATHQQCREAARLLRLRSVVRLETGDAQGTCDDAIALHQLGRLVGESPALIGHLVGIAIDATGKLATERIILSGRLTPEQARSFRRQIDALPTVPDIEDSFEKGERIVMLDTLWRLATKRYRSEASRAYLPTIRLDPNIFLRNTNAVYDAAVEALRENDPEERRRRIYEFVETLKADAYRSPNRSVFVLGMLTGNRTAITDDRSKIVVAMMFPAIDKAQRAEDRSMQYAQLVRWGAFLAEHHAIKSDWPARLDDISSPVGEHLAQNDLWGRPLQYHRLDEGFLLYSFGPNGKDDGGWQTGEWEERTASDDIRFGRMPSAVDESEPR